MSEQTTHNACGEIDWLEGMVDKLREENTRLRAAVAEMERMLAWIEYVEWQHPQLIKVMPQKESLSNYRQALQIALAKRNEL